MKKTKEEQIPLSGSDEAEILSRLSARVEKAIGTIGELRRERDALRKRLEEVEGQLREEETAGERLSALEEEQERFRSERSEMRERIETLLSNLEALDEDAVEE